MSEPLMSYSESAATENANPTRMILLAPRRFQIASDVDFEAELKKDKREKEIVGKLSQQRLENGVSEWKLSGRRPWPLGTDPDEMRAARLLAFLFRLMEQRGNRVGSCDQDGGSQNVIFNDAPPATRGYLIFQLEAYRVRVEDTPACQIPEGLDALLTGIFQKDLIRAMMDDVGVTVNYRKDRRPWNVFVDDTVQKLCNGMGSFRFEYVNKVDVAHWVGGKREEHYAICFRSVDPAG